VVRKRRTPEELSRQFEPSAQAIQNWVRQADRDSGRRHDGLTTEEREEVRRLRREVRPATKCLNGRLGYGDDLAR
jgi:transposase